MKSPLRPFKFRLDDSSFSDGCKKVNKSRQREGVIKQGFEGLPTKDENRRKRNKSIDEATSYLMSNTVFNTQ